MAYIHPSTNILRKHSNFHRALCIFGCSFSIHICPRMFQMFIHCIFFLYSCSLHCEFCNTPIVLRRCSWCTSGCSRNTYRMFHDIFQLCVKTSLRYFMMYFGLFTWYSWDVHDIFVCLHSIYDMFLIYYYLTWILRIMIHPNIKFSSPKSRILVSWR